MGLVDNPHFTLHEVWVLKRERDFYSPGNIAGNWKIKYDWNQQRTNLM